MHIIAADVGGTKTRLAFADSEDPGDVFNEACYQSGNFDGFEPMLQIFIQNYGAYIGNIALLFKPYGGIAAKISKRMQSEEFIEAYLNKGRMRALVEQITVCLVTNDRVGVLGAMSEAVKIQHNQMQQNLNQQVSE